MGRSRYHVLGTQPQFFTCTLVNWMPLFGQTELVQIIIESCIYPEINSKTR